MCQIKAKATFTVVDAAMCLGGDILLTLGFDECGQFVGREALGLA